MLNVRLFRHTATCTYPHLTCYSRRLFRSGLVSTIVYTLLQSVQLSTPFSSQYHCLHPSPVSTIVYTLLQSVSLSTPFSSQYHCLHPSPVSIIVYTLLQSVSLSTPFSSQYHCLHPSPNFTIFHATCPLTSKSNYRLSANFFQITSNYFNMFHHNIHINMFRPVFRSS